MNQLITEYFKGSKTLMKPDLEKAASGTCGHFVGNPAILKNILNQISCTFEQGNRVKRNTEIQYSVSSIQWIRNRIRF